MSKQILTYGVLSFLCITNLFSQPQADTILVYNIATKTTATILPTPYTATSTSDFTSSFPGSLGNTQTLSLAPPNTNLFAGSNFSDLALANSFFNLTYYPARTAVKLSTFYNDSLRGSCSGMIVGPCWVLTSAACVSEHSNLFIRPFINFDSIRVWPGFDNGIPQGGLPSSKISKMYMFKKFYNKTIWEDIALLEMNEPIGNAVGWTGLGFVTDSTLLAGKVFHKFSYPAIDSPFNPAKKYNGDTLYYNYGYISDLGPWFGVNSPSAQAIPGQGGSTFLYTNNNIYYSIGLSSYSFNYLHYKITPAAFYRLKNVINTVSCKINTTFLTESETQINTLKIFPNPFNDEAKIEFDFEESKTYQLEIINAFGIVVKKIEVNNKNNVITGSDLASGVYIIKLFSNNSLIQTVKVLVN